MKKTSIKLLTLWALMPNTHALDIRQVESVDHSYLEMQFSKQDQPIKTTLHYQYDNTIGSIALDLPNDPFLADIALMQKIASIFWDEDGKMEAINSHAQYLLSLFDKMPLEEKNYRKDKMLGMFKKAIRDLHISKLQLDADGYTSKQMRNILDLVNAKKSLVKPSVNDPVMFDPSNNSFKVVQMHIGSGKLLQTQEFTLTKNQSDSGQTAWQNQIKIDVAIIDQITQFLKNSKKLDAEFDTQMSDLRKTALEADAIKAGMAHKAMLELLSKQLNDTSKQAIKQIKFTTLKRSVNILTNKTYSKRKKFAIKQYASEQLMKILKQFG